MDTNFDKDVRIAELTAKGYNLQIGACIDEAFGIFKQDAGAFIGYILIVFVISLVLGIIPFVGSIASLVISPALNMGIPIYARKLRLREPVSFNDFFKGFDKLGDLLSVQIVSIIFIILGFLCFILPGIYLAIAYQFVTMMAYFLPKAGVWETLEKSRKLIGKEWFSFLAFFLVIVVLNIVGALCLVVGLLVTVPVSAIALYVCFEHLVGTNTEDDIRTQIENIGN